MRNMDSELERVDIKNRVYEAVKDTGKTSIDTEGAVQIGLGKYMGRTLASKKRAGCLELWKRLFARAVEGKVMAVEELLIIYQRYHFRNWDKSWKSYRV